MKKIFRKWYFWVGAFFLLIILIGSSGDSQKVEVASTTQEQATTQQVSSPGNDQVGEVAPTVKTTTKVAEKKTATQPTSTNTVSGYKVVSVVDGDTIKVSINGSTETIRIIGLNTPETVDPRKEVECFGKEASNKAKELLSNKTVTLEVDPSQGERDKYGRLLRYVFMDNGTDFSKYMITNGYAYEYTYNTPYKYQSSYKSAQSQAQANKTGLWAPNTCNGSLATTAKTPTKDTPGKFYTSSYSTSKYYYSADCEGWKSLDAKYLKSFSTLEALLVSYPSKIKSPQCN